MSFVSNQYTQIKNPQYYQDKANQLRYQNQILRKHLQNNPTIPNIQRNKLPINSFANIRNQPNYTFYKEQPIRQVIYRPSNQPIRPPVYSQKHPHYQVYAERPRTETAYMVPQRDVHYIPEQGRTSTQWQNRQYMRQMQDEIIELQARGYKLQRQANKLSSFIKDDLKDFLRDSNIHKQCSYKQKYLRAIANRPKYFRFNM